MNWVEWDFLTPPRDIKGIFIRLEDGKIYTDEEFYRSGETFDIKPIEWSFIERKRCLTPCNILGKWS